MLFSSLMYSQTKFSMPPNYTLIKNNIEAQNSHFYYPKLIKRLSENDTLLTVPEYLHLYYGYALQKQYNPYGYTSQDKTLKEFYKKDSLTMSEAKEYIKVARKSLEEYPMDIGLMNLLAYAYHQSGDDATTLKIAANIRGLVTAILSTGDGQQCQSAFHVISVNHEYVLLSLFEIETANQTLSGNCDYIEFPKNLYKFPGVYFDVSKIKK